MTGASFSADSARAAAALFGDAEDGKLHPALNGWDYIEGGAGDDVVSGGYGWDEIHGGTG
ncbi:hypothetical protein JDW22_13195, partial [Kingella sp. Marseille-Q4569]|nr:hypothetical protein [Kingella bonacorsii]